MEEDEGVPADSVDDVFDAYVEEIEEKDDDDEEEEAAAAEAKDRFSALQTVLVFAPKGSMTELGRMFFGCLDTRHVVVGICLFKSRRTLPRARQTTPRACMRHVWSPQHNSFKRA
eukprot:3397643-Pleurochrysis_carterae.AAC.1